MISQTHCMCSLLQSSLWWAGPSRRSCSRRCRESSWARVHSSVTTPSGRCLRPPRTTRYAVVVGCVWIGGGFWFRHSAAPSTRHALIRSSSKSAGEDRALQAPHLLRPLEALHSHQQRRGQGIGRRRRRRIQDHGVTWTYCGSCMCVYVERQTNGFRCVGFVSHGLRGR